MNAHRQLRKRRRRNTASGGCMLNALRRVGNGTTGPVPPEPSAASGDSRSQNQNENLVAVTAQETLKESPHEIRGQAESAKAKPVRGVVLEFATKMRQSRGREVLLND